MLGQGWEGNGEVYKLHVDGDLSDGVMQGTDESDILVASDHHDGLHMGGGACLTHTAPNRTGPNLGRHEEDGNYTKSHLYCIHLIPVPSII